MGETEISYFDKKDEGVFGGKERTLNQEEIETLQRLDNEGEKNISNVSKVDVVGIIVGIKTMAAIYERSQDPVSSRNRFVNLGKTIKKAGISVEIEEEYPVMWTRDDWGELTPSVFARFALLSRPEDVDKKRYLKFGKKNKTEEEEKKIGELFGYPESSTLAFLGKTEKIEREEVFKLWGETDFSPFFQQLVMSRNNFKEEIDSYGRIIMETMKKYMPNSYLEYLNGFGFSEEEIRAAEMGLKPVDKNNYPKTNNRLVVIPVEDRK